MFGLIPRRNRGRELAGGSMRPFDDFERLWSRFLGFPLMEFPEAGERWEMTTEERENEMLVRAELPGFSPNEVHIEIAGDRLTIEAEHNVPATETPEAREREFTRVRREFTVPTGIDRDKVEAAFRNGVLEIHLPRTPEATPRKIEVKS
jgi:HSP20 family protein